MWFWFYNVALFVVALSGLVVAAQCLSMLSRQRRNMVRPLVNIVERRTVDRGAGDAWQLCLVNRGHGAAVGISVGWRVPPRVLEVAVSSCPDILGAGEELALAGPYEGAAQREVKLSVRCADLDGDFHVMQFDGERHRFNDTYTLPKLQRFEPQPGAEALATEGLPVESQKVTA